MNEMNNLNNLHLYDLYKKSPLESHKWESYFYIYEEIFSELKGKDITFVEVGVHNGGSLFMWKEYFGKNSRIVGVDLNPNAKLLEEYGFEIYIGSQNDSDFWDNFHKEVNGIDILLDDGSHDYYDQILTLNKAVLDLWSKILQSISLQEAKRPKRILLVLHSKTRLIWRTNSIQSAWSVLLENQIVREFLVQWRQQM